MVGGVVYKDRRGYLTFASRAWESTYGENLDEKTDGVTSMSLAAIQQMRKHDLMAVDEYFATRQDITTMVIIFTAVTIFLCLTLIYEWMIYSIQNMPEVTGKYHISIFFQTASVFIVVFVASELVEFQIYLSGYAVDHFERQLGRGYSITASLFLISSVLETLNINSMGYFLGLDSSGYFSYINLFIILFTPSKFTNGIKNMMNSCSNSSDHPSQSPLLTLSPPLFHSPKNSTKSTADS